MQYNHTEAAPGNTLCVSDHHHYPSIPGWGDVGGDYLQSYDFMFGLKCGSLQPTTVSTTRAGCFSPRPGVSVRVVCQNDVDAMEQVYATADCTGSYYTAAKPGKCTQSGDGHWWEQACMTLKN